MSSIDWLAVLLQTALACSAATLLVLALRRPVRAWLGASAAYLLWLAVPVTLLALLLPAPRMAAKPMQAVGTMVRDGIVEAATVGSVPGWSNMLLAAWLLGVIVMLLCLWRQQRRFVRGLGHLRRRVDGSWQAGSVAGLPALVGVFRPKVVVPAGFEQRYSAREQSLVLRHERVHLRRGDAVANAGLSLLQCLYWFNPLMPLLVRKCREDQELSCDERVIAHAAGARRSYADALLKTGLTLSPLPAGCHWQNHHPLKERIAMLKRPVPGRKQWIVMSLLSLALSSGLGYAAWAAQPARGAAEAGAMIYSTFVQADADGEQQRFELRQPAGQPFAFALTSPKGVEWKAEFILVPAAGGQLRLKGALTANGVPVSTPELLVNADESAGIRVSTSDGTSLLALDLRSSVSAVVAQTGDEGRAKDVGSATGRMPPPAYPRQAFDAGVTGKVVLRIEVDVDGRATDVTVTESSPRGVFDAAAVAAARQWHFTPAMKDGKAVAGAVQVPIWFDLDETASHSDASGGS